MIKLMIIDDEEEIRSGIRTVIRWEENGIIICGEAANGKEGLKLIQELSPDVLLLDIRMPVMSGIDLLETIRSRNLPVKSIILSGYDDFSYAQKALKLGASDYLLKPCRPEEIIETVLKVKNSIEIENSRKEAFLHLKEEFNKNLPIVKERYLAKLLCAGSKPKDKCEEIFELYHLNIHTGGMMTIIIRIDDFQAISGQNTYTEIELIKFAVKNIAEELLTAKFYCEVLEYNNDIVAILNSKDIEYEKHLLPVLNEIKANINKYFDITVSMGLGRCYDDVTSLHLSYYEALKSIEAKFFLGDNITIRFEEIQNEIFDENFYPAIEEKEILRCIKAGDSAELEFRVEDFFSALNPGQVSKAHLMSAGLALVLSLYHLCAELNVKANEIFGNSFSILDKVQKTDTFTQLKDHLVNVTKATFDKIQSRKNGNRAVDMAIKFIENNYSKDLSLEAVASNVFITPGYLSLLFKQEMGINFVEYLQKTRIEKSYVFLRDTSLKTYEVAYKVGYNDEKYFSQIFKKYAGMTPTQYRDSVNAC